MNLTHVDEQGRARMVDVAAKAVTPRHATASAQLRGRPETVAAIATRAIQKGDVLAVARVAGIMAAKRTAELIPLCHPLPLDRVELELSLDPAEGTISIQATAACTARTGVEMEALTAVSVAALTVYDMCKAVDRELCIERICLEEKDGGRSGHYRRGSESR